MGSIAFLDTEIDYNSGSIHDIGSVKDDGTQFHSSSIPAFINFLKGAQYVCGHNILKHDLLYIKQAIADAGVPESNVIDTLHLSALLFPAKPSHALLKDDKLSPEDANNPLNDAKNARDLLFDEINEFNRKPESLKQIYFLLLRDSKEFGAFFRFVGYEDQSTRLEEIILNYFKDEICSRANLTGFIRTHPIQLAYSLALINYKRRHSISPRWLLKNYPDIERILFLLRSSPCLQGCPYCNQRLDIHLALKR
jgi:ATP-dependent DNA helicase RecQ